MTVTLRGLCPLLSWTRDLSLDFHGGVGLSSRRPCPGLARHPQHQNPLRPVRYLLHPWNLELPLGTDRGPLNRQKRDVPTSLTKDVGVVWPPGPGTERRESRPETQTRVTTVLHRPYMEGTDWVKVIIPPHSPDVLFPSLLPRPLTRLDLLHWFIIYLLSSHCSC